MKLLVAVFFLFCISAFAQDAVVVELSSSDAAQAKELYSAKVAADAAWDKAYGAIVSKYSGFLSGAEFSKDFRFIVPRASASAITSGTVFWGFCL